MTHSAADRPRTRLYRIHPVLVLVALLVACAAATAAPEETRGLDAVTFDVPPAVDGDLSEWPEGPGAVMAGAEQLLPDRPVPWRGPDDLSGVGWVGVDRENLYLAFSIQDDQAFHPGQPWWHGDSIEVFLDFGLVEGEARPDTFRKDCWQIFLMPRNPETSWGVAFRGPRHRFDDGGLRGVRVACREREDGYDVEASLPLANFVVDADAAARVVGFAVALNDADDGPSSPGTYMSWNGQFELYRRPDHFSTLRLPARDTGSAATTPEGPASPLLLVLLAIAVALAGVLVLAGPAARAFAKLGPVPKVVGLALTGLLALLFVVDADRTESRAERAVRGALASLADEAQAVAVDATAVGALRGEDADLRAETLADLLRARRIPTVLPPREAAFVALRDLDAVRDGARQPYRLALDRARSFRLAQSAEADALALRIQLRSRVPREDEDPSKVVLGHVTVAPGQAAWPVEANPQEAGTQEIEIPIGAPGPRTEIRFSPEVDAPYSVLLGIEARRSGAPSRQVLLSTDTDDGVPILGGPGTPSLGRDVPAGRSHSIELPYVLGADRLWIVLTAADAFPAMLADDVVARLHVIYDLEAEDATAPIELRNGEHLVQESLPPGIQRPMERSSRTAYRWTDDRGIAHAHETIAVPLDPARRARRLEVVNLGGAGTLRLVAATVVRSGTPPPESLLGISPGAANGADLVFVVNPSPAFSQRLGRGPEGAVRLSRQVGPEDAPTRLTLSAPLPPAVARKQQRTEVALYTCLAIALLLLAFLSADAVERLRHLTHRLALAVLVAALVPLGATILLLDRTTRDRLESEHTARARAALAALQASLQESLRSTHDDARHLARHLASSPEGLDADRTARLVRLYREGALPPGTASLALVTEADGRTLQVRGSGRSARLQGPRWLTEQSGRTGLHVSPWDGLVMVASARSGTEDRWVRVALGVRADDAFLDEPVGAALSAQHAAAAVLDAQGIPLAATGVGGDDFLAALARHAGDLRAHPDADVLRRVEPVGPGGRPRLAVWQRMPTADSPGEAPYLVVGLDRTGIESTLAEQRERLAWLALFAVILVVGVAGLTARRVAAPIEGLVRVTEAVRRGEFDVEVPPAGTDEVGDLTIAFDQMRHDLKHRVADLDFLRRAQEALAGSLDHAHRTATVVDLMRESFAPDAVVLLDATSPGGPLTVVAEHGRSTSFGDRVFHAAPGGWLMAALEGEEPLEIAEPGRDPRVAAEIALGARLVEDRSAWLAVPLRTGQETSGLVVLAWDDPDAMPRGASRRLLEPLAGVCALAVHNARLYRLAALDDVTRLPGATAFEAALRTDVEHAVQGGPPVMLLRVGLDHVEHVTMRRSVEIAHDLLRSLAFALREVAGDRTRLGRLREDEFAVRMPGATRQEALALAETIRERLARVEVVPEAGGDPVGTTVTVGTARGPDDATSLEFLLDAAGRALAVARREGGDRVEDAARLDQALVDVPPYEEGTVVRSEKMVRLVEAARRAARTDTSVLITGETGTGKEVIANLVHRRSVRSERPFVKVNCAAFPETLLESELFGHERGAFTGADRRREGRFELADGGTLFLDEIAEMSPSAQVRLLRVLQERQFTRLGGTRAVSVDVRIIAATNRDTEQAVASGDFREDLYYRLNVIRLDLPPLRERREEIPHLVDRFLIDAARRIGRGPQRLDSAAMDILYRHPWPGNVRELKNAIERCAVMCDGEVAGPQHLQLDGSSQGKGQVARSAPRDDLNSRQRVLLDHLARHGRSTNREYYEMTDTSPRTGLRDLQDLMERGLLIRDGRRRGAVYRLP